MNKVFLGGTCNESTWRDYIINNLKINYFNPVVDDWNEEAQEKENVEKYENCNLHLYVITPKIKGVYSIAEVIDSVWTSQYSSGNMKTIFCYLYEDGDLVFKEPQIKSLDAVGRLVESHDGIWLKNLEEVVEYLNKESE